MGKKVIINADDLGMSEGFNEGAIKAPKIPNIIIPNNK